MANKRRQHFAVAFAILQAALNLPLEPLELGENDGTLERVHAPTHAYPCMTVAAFLSMHANLPHGARERSVVGENRTPIAVAPQRFRREEADAPNGRKAAALLAFIGRTETLGGVLDDR